jgi:hypothetical protein
MKSAFLSIDLRATKPKEPPRDDQAAPVLAFVGSNQINAEEALREKLDQDAAKIDPIWCEGVSDLLQNQPELLNRYDWIAIGLRLVEVIQVLSSRPNPRHTQCDIYTQLIADITTGSAHSQSGEIPFDVGLQLLHGSYDPDGTTEVATAQAVRAVEAQAIEIGQRLGDGNEQIKLMERRIAHWKSLATIRLAELRKEFEFRERIIYGSPSKRKETTEN